MKEILLLTTGGTIACVETSDGLTPELTGDMLIQKIPEIESKCRITIKEILNTDSSNMSSNEWIIIARAIYEGLKNYDGIVVTHGTDTMAYTTSAVSFMLGSVEKPVVFTGSQLPIIDENTDAVSNLKQAFEVAVSNLNKVCLVFNGKIILGTRAFKIHSIDHDAFISCNNSYLGRIENDDVYLEKIENSYESPFLNTNICDEVFLLKLIPGIKPEIIDFIVDAGYKGIVIEAFGLGGIPSENTNLLAHLREAAKRHNIPILVVSQCLFDGTNLEVYKVGIEAEKSGLISGSDISTEAAVTKLMWILGQTEDYEEIKNMLETNLCGEMEEKFVPA